jgi:hypothetical protein
MENHNEIKKKLKLAFKQMSGAIKKDADFVPLPEVSIKGNNGIIFCLIYPTRKSFVKISRGTKAFLMTDEKEAKKLDRVLIYTFNGHLVEIDSRFNFYRI